MRPPSSPRTLRPPQPHQNEYVFASRLSEFYRTVGLVDSLVSNVLPSAARAARPASMHEARVIDRIVLKACGADPRGLWQRSEPAGDAL